MKTSFPKSQIEIRLCEPVHSAGVALFRRERFKVSVPGKSPRTAGATKALATAHGVGVRSATQLDARALDSADRLLVVGCFCVGTNNVDLAAAARRGVPVFHAPHASTRSVAELTIGLLIALARRVVDKSHAARRGVWAKSADGCFELRGRTLGIVGYGHVGSQVSVLAEALGMRVVFHDIADKQALGNARPVGSLDELLRAADMVTLHVPEDAGTRGLIGPRQIKALGPGGYLVNTSRGSVIDEDALAAGLESGHVAGAALDVLASEPSTAGGRLRSRFRRRDDVILTPHVGGSTAEAQERIAEHVARRMIRFINEGSTVGAVNFPQVELPRIGGSHRLIHVHRNVPGVLSSVNGVFGRLGANIEAQFLQTDERIGYLVVDVDRTVSAKVVAALDDLPETIRTRRLF